MSNRSDQTFNSGDFLSASRHALSESSRYIKDCMLGNVDLSKYLVKGDKTAVTVVDKRSEAIARDILKSELPGFTLYSEEGKGVLRMEGSPITQYHDPLDGTGGLLTGGITSTTILSAYDHINKTVLAVATMEPISGRFWYSAKGEGAHLSVFNYQTNSWEVADPNKGLRPLEEGELGKKLQVNPLADLDKGGAHFFVDVDHNFTRESIWGQKRQALTKEGRRHISRGIDASGNKTTSFYTNGLHFALTAMGNPTVAGNFTSAIGGPFDVAGTRHVLEAGGVIQCYTVYDTTTGDHGFGETQKESETFNPETKAIISFGDGIEEIEKADFVIAANNHENLTHLERILSEAIKVQ